MILNGKTVDHGEWLAGLRQAWAIVKAPVGRERVLSEHMRGDRGWEVCRPMLVKAVQAGRHGERLVQMPLVYSYQFVRPPVGQRRMLMDIRHEFLADVLSGVLLDARVQALVAQADDLSAGVVVEHMRKRAPRQKRVFRSFEDLGDLLPKNDVDSAVDRSESNINRDSDLYSLSLEDYIRTDELAEEVASVSAKRWPRGRFAFQ